MSSKRAVVIHWNEILGQTRAQGILAAAIDSDRMHHGYLFAGPLGVGKASTALAFAASLNCLNRKDDGFVPACGACNSCRKIGGNQHPDVRWIVAEGKVVKTLKISQIREVQRAASTRPYEGRYQIIIIDEAHKMTKEAANALLKTLEEPPPTMKLVLVTEQPAALLDTIRSRCQLLRFAPLSPAHVSEILGKVATDAPQELVPIAALYGEGSVGRAQQLLESGLLDTRRDILTSLLESSAKRPLELLASAEAIAKERETFHLKLEFIKIFLRDVAIAQTVQDPKSRIINQDMMDEVLQVGRTIGSDEVMKRIDQVSEAQRLLDRHVNAQMIAEDLLTELAI